MVCRIVILCLLVGAALCDYQLDVRVNFYNNFFGGCAGCKDKFDSYLCCDSNSIYHCTGEELCDTLFSFCLRPLASSTPGCPNNHTTANYTEGIAFNTDTLVYDDLQTIFGPNPISFTGPELTDIQFYIQSEDDDSDQGLGAQLIDAFWVNISNTMVGGERIKSSYYFGHYELADIELTFEVVCTDNFSLPDCTPCEPQPDDDELCINRQQVLHEFPGELPEPDVSTSPSFVPTPDPTGVCSDQRCSDRGRCEESLISYYCVCWPGYTGRDCETVISEGGRAVGKEAVTTDVGLVLNGTVGGLLVIMLVVVIALLVAIIVALRRQGRSKKFTTDSESTTNSMNLPVTENAGYSNSLRTEEEPKL